MKIYHLLKIHFDRRGPQIDQKWLTRRFDFFIRWTDKSLRRQRFQDFRVWFHCDPFMQQAMEGLREATRGDDHIFTFGPYGTLPDVDIGDADYVFITRIDSDDLYSEDALQIIADLRPMQPGRVEAGIFRRGYLHDVRTGQVGVYHNQSSPFHVVMFPRDVFLDPKLYLENLCGDHSQVNARYPVQSLPDWKFCVLVHGGNFLSTFDYGRQKDALVERGWSVERFLTQPVTFDVDDESDEWDCLPEMDRLKAHYENFRATLFCIPHRCNERLLRELKKRDWLELGVHGADHEPNEEMKEYSRARLRRHLLSLDYSVYAKVFRPPGWFLTAAHVAACNDVGLAVAMHVNDAKELGPLCQHGFYVCNDKPYSHHHSHRVCSNWVRDDLPMLLAKWPRDQQFSFVSDSVLVRQ